MRAWPPAAPTTAPRPHAPPGPEEVLLADVFVQRPRPHPRGQRRVGRDRAARVRLLAARRVVGEEKVVGAGIGGHGENYIA